MISCFRIKAVILVLSICYLKRISSLLYNELRSYNVSCYPSDSCHRRHFQETQSNPGDESTCECDSTCYKRGTCCIDSPYVDPRPSTRTEVCDGELIIGVGHFYYFNRTHSYSFFQVNKCPRRWNRPVQVKELCEMKKPVDGVDLMVAIPVTNTRSGISYKNYFCAICNSDLEGSVLWDFAVHKDFYGTLLSDRFSVQASEEIPVDTSEENDTCDGRRALAFVYSEKERFYGYWDYCTYDSPRFIYVTVSLSIPMEIVPYVKGCRSNLVSKCAPGWGDLGVKQKCLAYMGIIKDPGMVSENGFHIHHQYFRNAHCAVCNNVTNFEGYSCEPFSQGTPINNPTYPTSSTVLFDHLLSDQGCLGDNEKFVKGLGCRAVLCASSFVVKNGKCTLP